MLSFKTRTLQTLKFLFLWDITQNINENHRGWLLAVSVTGWQLAVMKTWNMTTMWHVRCKIEPLDFTASGATYMLSIWVSTPLLPPQFSFMWKKLCWQRLWDKTIGNLVFWEMLFSFRNTCMKTWVHNLLLLYVTFYTEWIYYVN